MGRKDLKNRTPINSAMENSLYNELKEYSSKTGIPISKLLDKMAKMFLESIKKQ